MENSFNFASAEKDAIENLIDSWLDLLELRDLETKDHSDRVATLAVKLAQKLGLNRQSQEKIYYGALLHDIGKIGIPESILLKAGPLTNEEFITIQQHTLLAHRMLADNKILSEFTDIPLYHHERWDGNGYPYGKKGKDIPIEARVFSVIDAWDAMTNDRPYRKAMLDSEAIGLLREGEGSQFDPEILDAFIEMIDVKTASLPKAIRIMVVDDEPNLLLGLTALLTGAGFEVTTAANGKEGLKQIEKSEPDLILCDIMMPKMSGFEFRKALSMMSYTAEDIPFIFLTARNALDDKMAGYKLKVDDYIIKPFEPAELINKITAILNRKHKTQRQEQLYYSKKLNSLKQLIRQNVTHELKSPLGVIIGNLDIALRSIDLEKEARLVPFITDARNSATRLQSVINDLIYLYQTDNGLESDSGLMLTGSADTIRIIEDTANLWRGKGLSISINVEPDLEFYVPSQGFTLSIHHLVENACKFANQNGCVKIDFKQDQNRMVFSVENDGNRIPSLKRDLIFDRYYQLSEGSAREYSGLGIGLSIVKSFAQSMGGEVSADDSSLGTRVDLTFPFMNEEDKIKRIKQLEDYY